MILIRGERFAKLRRSSIVKMSASDVHVRAKADSPIQLGHVALCPIPNQRRDRMHRAGTNGCRSCVLILCAYWRIEVFCAMRTLLLVLPDCRVAGGRRRMSMRLIKRSDQA